LTDATIAISTEVRIMATRYEFDYYGWTIEQTKLLQEGKLSELDKINLIEELSEMGRSTEREFASRLEQLMLHLLKWQYQSHLQSKSWFLSIKEQRQRIIRLIEKNPSLKPKILDLIGQSYEMATLMVERETGIEQKSLPHTCPYNWEELINSEFLPGNKL
jgi:Domain of unknown function DUF29